MIQPKNTLGFIFSNLNFIALQIGFLNLMPTFTHKAWEISVANDTQQSIFRNN